jgi:hypothetical protein
VLIPRKESNAMHKHTTSTAIPIYALKAEALASMSASFKPLAQSRESLAYGRLQGIDVLGAGANAICFAPL